MTPWIDGGMGWDRRCGGDTDTVRWSHVSVSRYSAVVAIVTDCTPRSRFACRCRLPGLPRIGECRLVLHRLWQCDIGLFSPLLSEPHVDGTDDGRSRAIRLSPVRRSPPLLAFCSFIHESWPCLGTGRGWQDSFATATPLIATQHRGATLPLAAAKAESDKGHDWNVPGLALAEQQRIRQRQPH